MFLGGIERDQWHEMGKYAAEDFLERAFFIFNFNLNYSKNFQTLSRGYQRDQCYEIRQREIFLLTVTVFQ